MDETISSNTQPEASAEHAGPTRRRTSRRRRKPTSDSQTSAAPVSEEVGTPPEQPPVQADRSEAPARRHRRRRRRPVTEESPGQAPPVDGREEGGEARESLVAPAPPLRRRREAVDTPQPADGVRTPSVQAPFVHPAEEEFAHLLDFYGVKWLYEPRSFPLRWDGERMVEMFTPDFYLPELDLYVELTTLKQSLVTEKNRKLRHLHELYPEINIKLLYRRDIHRLLAKYGYGPLAEADVSGIEQVLFTKPQIERRVAELGRQVSKDYAGEQPVLVGVLRGVICFMSDLMRQTSLPLSIDLMSISYFSGTEGSEVRITKDLDIDLEGRHVLLVEDIVDTGMTLKYLLQNLAMRHPASIKVCALLDKRIRRLVDVKLDYVGFEVPDEFLVGYGLDHLEKYRNLPFIGILKPGEQAPTQGRGSKKEKPQATWLYGPSSNPLSHQLCGSRDIAGHRAFLSYLGPHNFIMLVANVSGAVALSTF